MPSAAIAVGSIVGGGLLQSRAAGKAAKTAAGATRAGIAEQRRQFDVAQELQQPFLQAGQEALGQFRAGIDRSPQAPTLQQFGGQAVGAPTLQQFSGQAVGAPTLQQFQFDPSQVLNNPAIQFQLEQGGQALQRNLASNRQLGSGRRLLEAQQFGQGVAAQGIGDEFRRQLQTSQQQAGLAGQQFGLNTQQLGQEQALNQLGNQQAIQQQGLERQNLADRLNLSQVEQNRLLQQFGLSSGQFNERLNRLAGLVDVGARTGGTLGGQAQQTGANVSNLLQAGGNTQAAAQLGQGNIASGALQQLSGLAGQSGIFNPNSFANQQAFNFQGNLPGGPQPFGPQ